MYTAVYCINIYICVCVYIYIQRHVKNHTFPRTRVRLLGCYHHVGLLSYSWRQVLHGTARNKKQRKAVARSCSKRKCYIYSDATQTQPSVKLERPVLQKVASDELERSGGYGHLSMCIYVFCLYCSLTFTFICLYLRLLKPLLIFIRLLS